MLTFPELLKEAEHLATEEKAGLAAHLLALLPHSEIDSSDEEVARREAEMDSGAVEPISYSEFRRQVGR